MSSPTTLELSMSVFCTLTKIGPFFGTSRVTTLGAPAGFASFGFAPIAAPPWVVEEFILSVVAALPVSGLFGAAFCATALAPATALTATAASRNLRMTDLLRAQVFPRNANALGKFQFRSQRRARSARKLLKEPRIPLKRSLMCRQRAAASAPVHLKRLRLQAL